MLEKNELYLILVLSGFYVLYVIISYLCSAKPPKSIFAKPINHVEIKSFRLITNSNIKAKDNLKPDYTEGERE